MANRIIDAIDKLLIMIVLTLIMLLPDAPKNEIIFCALSVSITATFFIKRKLEKIKKK